MLCSTKTGAKLKDGTKFTNKVYEQSLRTKFTNKVYEQSLRTKFKPLPTMLLLRASLFVPTGCEA